MRTLRMFVVCTFAFVLFFGIAAQAQTAELPIRVHVPFAFQVGNAQFSAGDYMVYQAADRLHIRNAVTGELGAFVTVAAVRNPRDLSGSLEFIRRDGKHFLTKVWAPGLESGADLTFKN